MSKNIRAEYLGHLSSYQASGLSIKKYCDQHGLAEHKFIYYRNYELKKQKRAQPPTKFAKVIIEPQQPTAVIDPGYYVDPVWLAQFVDKLLKSR